MNLIFLLVMLAAMYALLILPQQRQRKATAAMQRSLSVGDEVMTSGGIFGTVAEVEDDVVWLAVAEGVEMKVVRAAVVRKVAPASADTGAEPAADTTPESDTPADGDR